MPTENDVWQALKGVSDPEIPVLSVLDLKIVRAVEVHGDEVNIDITPTFLGCPALDLIAENIRSSMLSMGFKTVQVRKNFVARWSTDELDQATREKLVHFGIAPPRERGTVVVELPVVCPFCQSSDTIVESPFGATLCKQLCYCNSCKQSFEQFRAI